MEYYEKSLALYKVQAKNWNEPEFVAASNQLEAINNVKAKYKDITPQTCSVVYIGDVYLHPDDVNRIVELEEENAKLKHQLEVARAYMDEEGKVLIPTVEQIKSVYAAAGVMEQMNEHADAKNLNALWEDLNKVLENYNETHGFSAN